MNPEDMTTDDLLRHKNEVILRLTAELEALDHLSGMTVSQIHRILSAKDDQIKFLREKVSNLEWEKVSNLESERDKAGRDR